MTKRYYTKDIERILGISRKNLYYWERVGKVPKAKRTNMGDYRYWTKADVDRLKKIIGEG